MKKLILSIISLITMACNNQKQVNIDPNTTTPMGNIYEFKVTDIDGEEFDLTEKKKKKVMIVNTASKCGFTPQYD